MSNNDNNNDGGKCIVCEIILDKGDANVCIECDKIVYFNGKIIGNNIIKKKRIMNSYINNNEDIFIDVLKNKIFKSKVN